MKKTKKKELVMPAGKAYLSESEPISGQPNILAALINGKEVELPSAVVSSYGVFFKEYAGCLEVKVIDWTSSAGDWCFGVNIEGAWYHAYQYNRYPYFGFKYTIDISTTAESFNDLNCDIQ